MSKWNGTCCIVIIILTTDTPPLEREPVVDYSGHSGQ